MPDEADRATKAVVIHTAILDILTKLREAADWKEDIGTVLAFVDALSNHLCVVSKFMNMTLEELKLNIELIWNQLEEKETKDMFNNLPSKGDSN